jgi:hypothetical protein
MDQSEVDAVLTLLSSRPRPVGWPGAEGAATIFRLHL